MIGAWMLYVLLFSGALGLAALVLERALARAGWPVRWSWAGAMAASVFVPAALPLASGMQPGMPGGPPGGVKGLAVLIEAQRLTPGGGFFPSPALERALLFGWVGTSLVLLVVLLLSVAALRRDRRGWRRASVAGAPVFLSESMGPAVAGLWRPVIVLPAWALSWEEPLQRLVIVHEREHIRAGDSRLLWGALAALVLTPWNLPLWWQFRRLRLAIEIDCDARVLRGPVSPREYGSLLLEVARMPGRRPLALAAFASASLGLRARIRLLARPKRRAGSGVGVALAGLALLLPLAVQAKVPAPRLPSASYLVRLAAPDPGGPRAELVHGRKGMGPPFPLPRTPTPEEISAAIERHHPAALTRRIAPEETLWFMVAQDGRVLHTGVERGSIAEIRAAVDAQHPDAVYDHVLYFEHTQPGAGPVHVLWLFPGPAQ